MTLDPVMTALGGFLVEFSEVLKHKGVRQVCTEVEIEYDFDRELAIKWPLADFEKGIDPETGEKVSC